MESKLLPSLLAADFYNLSEELTAIERAGVTGLHLDIMDRSFVPNLSFGPGLVQKLRPHTDLFFDCHLMVAEPDDLLETFQAAGASLVTVHWEACYHVHRSLQKIHELGMKAGLALNPATPPEVVTYLLDEVDLILVMSVNPGFGGQTFIPSSYTKLQALRQMIDVSGRPIILEADGGIGLSNAQAVLDAGCDWLVAGSAVFSGQETENRARALRQLIEGK